jgi:hypothetical protein
MTSNNLESCGTDRPPAQASAEPSDVATLILARYPQVCVSPFETRHQVWQ